MVLTLPGLPGNKQQRMRFDSIKDKTAQSRTNSIHQLFEAQVERTPDAVAVVFEAEQLTYRELNARANQLAHYLRARGVCPEVLVGICVERSLEMIVGLLGILKAGGAYLPLDPFYPRDRLSFMLDDAKAPMLLTKEALLGTLLSPAIDVIALDTDWDNIGRESDQNPESQCTPQNLAYVIYTSGSTGRPKGVCVAHSSVVHLISECQSVLNLGSNDVWTVVHSYAFDFSVWEIFGPLLSGSRLVVVPLEVVQSPSDFYQLLAKEKVTILNQTPSAARQLLEATKNRSCDDLNLRLVICGGEALPSTLAAELLGWNIPFWNFYGPTESTVWATIKRVEQESLGQSSVSIGSSITGLEAYILDQDLRPVSVGVAGELHLGGHGLARGYLNSPTLTAGRFIPNAFSDGPGARLYKTGDLARHLPDGEIEHLGRLDHQVKVRGFRIELEEIEAVISQHPAVEEAVVTAREDTPEEKRLVAYVVTKPSSNTGDSQTSLQDQRLSDWMAIWNETYSQPSQQDDPTFNIIGWNSSYTGLPYSVEEMEEWVDHSVQRILALNPNRVLEIGCGSGLLLFRIAPQCEYYFGTEPSERALAFLEMQLKSKPQLSHVTLSQRMADDFEGLEPKSFDTVVINSVAQYFPSLEYLVKVLEGAVRLVKPGGAIFIGDVRNLALLTAFHISLQVNHAPNSLSAIDLLERVRRGILQDEQLAIDPSFFNVLPTHLGRISHVEVQLKRGSAQNETTKFRYDVCLHIGTGATPSAKNSLTDWEAGPQTVSELRRVLAETGPQNLVINHVTNARLLLEIKALDLLAANGIETVGDLRGRLRAEVGNPGIDPEEWWEIGEEFNCAVEVTWSASGKRECYDVILRPRAVSGQHAAACAIAAKVELTKDWRCYGNDPLQGVFTRRLLPHLRSFLRNRLPEYMIPSTFVLLDSLPLTPNAKLDRAALPAPDSTRPELEEAFQPPRNEVEAKLAEIWAGILKLDRVGIYDNFMELGGHSVLATQIISRVRDVFHVELPLRSIFESPTVNELSKKIGPRKTAETPPLQHAVRTGRLPLSYAQQRLWFLDQLVPGTPVYNIPAAVRLPCEINVDALRQSLNEIIRRHETLRTTIAIVDGEPIQVVAPDLKLALPLIDLQELPKTKREAESRRLAKEQAEGPFDLAQGPLMRALLLQPDQEEYVLLLTMHHIISDNWSIIVFFEELSALYEAFIAGRPSPLLKLPIQYQDYAVWQRDELQRDALDAQVDYWKGQLAGAPHVLELPTDWPRPSIVSFRAERQSLTLSKSLVNAVRTMSQRESVTTFMTLLAVFNVLLHRYTGQDDILVGSPIANRTRTETEYLIGLFLNNLVLRTRFSDDSDFRQLLAQVRDVALGAYANQDVPFEQLVAELQSQRDLSRTPLFQVFFNLFDSSDNKVKLSGITAEVFSPVSTWSQFDLTLYAAEDDDTIQLTLSYNIELFAPARIAAMLEQFGSLLEQIVAQPDKKISEYSLVTPTGFAVLPDPTEVLPTPAHEPITESFFSRARESPDHPAICRGEESYKYSQLAEEARSIACSLLDGALKKGDVVAVSGSPSFGLIAGMLGVLSSGGVLLTLDQNLPRERQKLMVREAGAKRLLYVGEWRTEDDWIRELPSVAITRVRENGRMSSESAQTAVPVSFCLPELSPSDAAYLFFTSGTSGVPKGVLGCHKGLSHFLKWQREEFGITAEDRAAQLTGLSFDVVLRDIFLPLTSGASLHLPDDSTDAASSNILSWLDRERISILHTVPTPAQTWLNYVPEGVSLRSLRWVFFAGESLTDSLVLRWREAFPASGKLVNLYGPTETTLAKCFHIVPDEPAYGVQPVGRPLPETQALVLGSANHLCGIGEPGEIVIRTPFRSLGYINAAEEQQARFIRNPFTHDADDLLYRTGDRGRYQPDGTLEILGRLDEQIKIRGVRVEPEEVNAILSRHPLVAGSIVVSLKDHQGENALAAYVVHDTSDSINVAELREYLAQKLPPALVPTYFVTLEKLPLTANGKVDRRALPQPDPSLTNLKREFIAPRNETEELVSGVWSEVLGLSEIGIHDNFFELGGHSLRATQVLSRINAIFNIEMRLSAVFEHSTVAGLAAAIEDHLVAQLESLPEDEAHQLFR